MEFNFIDMRPLMREIHSNDGFHIITLGAGSYIVTGDVPEPRLVDLHILVGSYSSISEKIRFIIARDHDYHAVTTYPFYAIRDKLPEEFSSMRDPNRFKQRRQVIIGNDVWIGKDVSIVGGVKIGTGSVIGANASIAKDIPPYSVVVGNPARVVKYRFEPEIIRKLLAIKWWNWDQKKILANHELLQNPNAFVEKYYSPELENFPRDGIGDHLRNLKSHGMKIFASVLDFKSIDPLWKKIMEDFSKSELSNSVLICYAMKNVSDEDFRKAVDFSDQLGANIIVSDLSIDALRESDIFITTKNFNSMRALDYLYDKNIDVRCAIDDAVFF